MRVVTDQPPTFADSLVTTPPSELDRLTHFIDWDALCQPLQPIKADYSVTSLFKGLLLQTWYNLSDAALSSALHRDIVFMKFCDFTLDGKKPDAATICRFRQRLIKAGLLNPLLSQLNATLEQGGLKLAQGKYVSADATLIKSARRPRKQLATQIITQEEQVEDSTESYEMQNVEYSDDVDAKWIKKGKDSVYGYSATFTTDETGMVEAVSTHPANESEMTRFAEDIAAADIEKGKRVLYDKGASSHTNREALKSQGLKDGIMRKKPKGRAMRYWEKERNRLISKKRFVTERTFGTLKRVYGLSRARYVGIAKVHGEVQLKSIAYNLKRAMNIYSRWQDRCA